MKKTLKVILQFILVWGISLASSAQTDGNPATKRLEELNSTLDARIEELKLLAAEVDNVPEMDREAVIYRRDERTFRLLKDLDELARGVAQLPEDDELRQQLTARLKDEFATLPDLMFQRSVELSERISKLNKDLDSLSGTSRLAMEAYIHSLESLRIESYQAVANIVQGRAALGLPTEQIVGQLTPELYLRAETLVGRLRYSRAAGDALRSRLAQDPQNAELIAAVKTFGNSRINDLNRLESISGLLQKLGQRNDLYTSVLLQQGQSLSVRDFDLEVVVTLVKDVWHSLRESLVEQAPDLMFNFLIFVLILLIFRFLSRLTRRGVILACERSGADMSTLLKDVLASVSGGVVMIFGVLIALAQVGISLGPMLAGLGVAGFIVGFALQDTLGNFAAGGMILIYRPYDVDDFVEVVGASGLVKKMSLVSTTITTFDNQTLVVPNSKIWGDVIKNVTAQRIRRVDLEFGIGYGDDIEHAERVLENIISKHELVLKKPVPLIKLHTLADSSVNFIVRPWVKTSDYWDVYWDITREVKVRFDQEGISIPFPQRDVHFYPEQPV